MQGDISVSDSSIDSLRSIFEASKISQLKGAFYILTDGSRKRASSQSAIQLLNMPESLLSYPDLGKLYLENKFKFSERVSKELERFLRDRDKESMEDVILPENDLGGAYSVDDHVSETLEQRGYQVLLNADPNPDDALILVDPSRDYQVVHGVNMPLFFQITKKKEEAYLSDETLLRVRTTYSPDKPIIPFRQPNEKGEMKTYVNLHITPPWRNMDVGAAYPDKIREFMEHLFVDEGEREKVLDHLHYMVARRCAVALILVGFKKIGKSIFASRLLKALVGPGNYNRVNESAITERFNSGLKNFRVVFFDEVSINTEQIIQRIKNYTNDEISIEEKGRDQYRLRNYASLVFATNKKGEIKISTSDRRFSIPEITADPLESKWSPTEICSFVDELENPQSEMVAQFGKWLLEREPTIGYDTPIKGSYYMDIVQTSMNNWQYLLFKALLETTESVIHYHDLKKEYKQEMGDARYFPRRNTIEDFLEENPIEEGVQMARIISVLKGGRRMYEIRLTPEFLEYKKDRVLTATERRGNSVEIVEEEDEEESWGSL